MGNIKKIKRVYLSRNKFGVVKIDLFVSIASIGEKNAFGVGWCYVLSTYKHKIEKKFWDKVDD